MRKQLKNIIAVLFLLGSTFGFSQKKPNDTLNTGVIDVVKPYTPSISDAFKVKETPNLSDETTQTKKEVAYSIFSFPVASTFTPAKGKAATVNQAKPTKLFDNYASLAVGSYTTILGDVYLNHAISRSESIGGHLSHHSSGGGIDGLSYDDDFIDSKAKINYSSRLRDLSWNVEGGLAYQRYNWYGVAQPQLAISQTNGIAVDHAFFSAHIGGDVSFEETYINSASVLFRHFSDDQGSGENRLSLKAKIDVPINTYEISTDVMIDYLGGGFDRNYNTTTNLNYGNFQIGMSPTYQIIEDDLTLNLGVSVFYMRVTETNENKLFLYPNITASYNLVNELLIAYGGIQGDLIQNTYHGFANENPFVSPTLIITPTDQLYNAYVGLKGKITSDVSYNVSGRYTTDRNKALFKNNEITTTAQNYSYGNSFGIVYDDVKTLSLSAEVNVDINRHFTLALKGETLSYNSQFEAEAWNLPDFKASLFLDYQINQKWFAGANLFYVGERHDQVFVNDGISMSLPSTLVLDSYFDANAHVGYYINEQLSIFAKVNNIANEAYQKWQNFPVQSVQFLAGATYKFDF